MHMHGKCEKLYYARKAKHYNSHLLFIRGSYQRAKKKIGIKIDMCVCVCGVLLLQQWNRGKKGNDLLLMCTRM